MEKLFEPFATVCHMNLSLLAVLPKVICCISKGKGDLLLFWVF